MDETKTNAVLAEVAAERARQDARWGEQNHPILGWRHDSLSGPDGACVELGIPPEREARWSCEQAFKLGRGSYAHILVEEVSEAIAAADESDARARAELVQVAAVAVAAVEAIDRRARHAR